MYHHRYPKELSRWYPYLRLGYVNHSGSVCGSGGMKRRYIERKMRRCDRSSEVWSEEGSGVSGVEFSKEESIA